MSPDFAFSALSHLCTSRTCIVHNKLAAKSLVCTFLRHVTPAVSSDKHEVDGYIRVGPNKWMRCDDIMDDVA